MTYSIKMKVVEGLEIIVIKKGKYDGTAHNICNLAYKTSEETSKVFHNISDYGYHFIIKELAEEFNGQLHYNFFSTNTERKQKR